MKKLAYTAALVALVLLTIACDCDKNPITNEKTLINGADRFYARGVSISASDFPRYGEDYFYSSVTEEERESYSRIENYSIQQSGTEFRVMCWLKDAAYEATRGTKKFKSKNDAMAYAVDMAVFYRAKQNEKDAEREQSISGWTTVWGRKK